MQLHDSRLVCHECAPLFVFFRTMDLRTQKISFLTQVVLIQELLEVGILVSSVGFLFLGKTQLYSSVLVLASLWR